MIVTNVITNGHSAQKTRTGRRRARRLSHKEKLINPAGNDGLLFGNPSLFGTQVVAVAATWAYSIAATFVLLKILDATMGLRVEESEEDEGLDVSQHGESAYELE